MSEPEDDELPFEEEVGEIADDCAGTILAELAESYGLDENDLRLYDLIIEPIRQAIRAVLDRVEKEEAKDTWFSAHAQATVISQIHGPFHALYTGPRSLLPVSEAATSMTGRSRAVMTRILPRLPATFNRPRFCIGRAP